MTSSLRATAPVPAAATADLTALIETAAYFAAQWFGARALLVERSAESPGMTTVSVIAADGVSRDLWQLDALLWDDVQWAAAGLLEPGEFALFASRHR